MVDLGYCRVCGERGLDLNQLGNINSLIMFYLFYMNVCMYVCGLCVGRLGDNVGVGSLLLTCGFLDSNLGCQTQQQVPLPTKSSQLL